MDVLLNSTDTMEMDVRHPDDSILYEGVEIRFELWSYKRKAVFGMPGYVEIDLGVCADGHKSEGKGVNALYFLTRSLPRRERRG